MAEVSQQGMKRLGDLVAVIGFSIGGLLFFYIPVVIHNDDFNSILSYTLIAVTFFYITWSYKLPSLAYFRLPEISISSLAGLLVVALYSWNRVTNDYSALKPFWSTVVGIIYIFTIGFGEELLSRGFVFGVLKKYGTFYAVLVSSLLFGLMHLNVYTGDDWDPVHAYLHCFSAFGFGLLSATVMIACRSILAPIVLHSLYDWHVYFAKPIQESGSDEPWEFVSLWETFTDGLADIAMDLFFVLILVAVIRVTRRRRGKKLPKAFRPLKPILLKLGLVEEVKSVTY